MATEISMEDEINGRNVEFPLLVPTLGSDEMAGALAGNFSPGSIEKARSHALARILRNQSPFAGPQDLRFPIP
jgi:hypothetical protein